jgi:hypothetical protein
VNLDQLAIDISSAYIPPDTGRPSVIGDHETIKTFLTAVHDGNYIDTACELADISVETYRQWTKRADEGEQPFKALVAATKRASAIAEAMEVGKVRTAGKDPRFWAASMTYLERRHPERWARRSDGHDGPKVVVQIGVRDSDVQVRIANVPSAPAIEGSDLRSAQNGLAVPDSP